LASAKSEVGFLLWSAHNAIFTSLLKMNGWLVLSIETLKGGSVKSTQPITGAGTGAGGGGWGKTGSGDLPDQEVSVPM